MTMTPGELERKVRQLDNEVQSIYEMLAVISAQQARQGKRLDQLERKMDARFDNLQVGLNELSGGLNEVLGLLRAR